MALFTASISKTGLKHRTNEDRLLCNTELSLLAVADGMSQPAGGDVASEVAVKTLEEYCLDALAKPGAKKGECLEEGFQAADFMVCQTASNFPQYIGMGTTLVSAIVDQSRVHIANVGDSRCYLFRKGHVQRMTQDQLSENESGRKILSQCVGLGADLKVEMAEIDAVPNDLFMLCSDGASDCLDEFEVSSILEKNQNLEDSVVELSELAVENGSKDDVTIVLFKFS